MNNKTNYFIVVILFSFLFMPTTGLGQDDLEKRLSLIEKNIKEIMEKGIQDIGGRLAKIEDDLKGLPSQKSEIEKHTGDLSLINTSIQSISQQLKTLEVPMSLLSQRVDEIEKNLKPLAHALQDKDLQEKLSPLLVKIGELEKLVLDHEKSLSRVTSLEAKVHKLEEKSDKELDLYRSSLAKIEENLKKETTSLSERIQKLEEETAAGKALQGRIASLETQVPQIENRLVTIEKGSNQVDTKTIASIDARLTELEKLRKLEERFDKLEKEYSGGFEKRIKDLEEKLTSWNEKITKIGEFEAEISKKANVFGEKCVLLETKLTKFESDLGNNQVNTQDKIKTIESVIPNMKAAIEKEIPVLASNTREIKDEFLGLKDKYEKETEKFTKSLTQLQEKVAESGKQQESLPKEVGKINESITEIKNELSEVRKDNDRRISNMFTFVTTNTADKKDFQKLGDRVQTIQDLTGKLQEENERFKDQDKKFESDIQNLNSKDDSLVKKIDENKGFINNLNNAREELISKLSNFKEELKANLEKIAKERQIDQKWVTTQCEELSKYFKDLKNEMLSISNRGDKLEEGIQTLRKVDEGIQSHLQDLANGAKVLRGNMVQLGRQMVQLFETDTVAAGEGGPQKAHTEDGKAKESGGNICERIGIRLVEKKMWDLAGVFLNLALNIDPNSRVAGELLNKYWGEIYKPRGMIYIPAGAFYQGNKDNAEKIELNHGFYIDKTEVTVKEYEKFISAGGYDQKKYWSENGWKWREEFLIDSPYRWEEQRVTGKEKLPVVGISWYEASAYAAWKECRLPSEEEWEKAARGDCDARTFPWGEDMPFSAGKYRACYMHEENTPTLVSPAPVSKYWLDKSPYGVKDMAGNVSEWCSDWFEKDYKATRVVRGGSWNTLWYSLSVYSRSGVDPEARSLSIGFRCVKDLNKK